MSFPQGKNAKYFLNLKKRFEFDLRTATFESVEKSFFGLYSGTYLLYSHTVINTKNEEMKIRFATLKFSNKYRSSAKWAAGKDLI